MNRDRCFDIAKGIGIFFLVSMHAYWWLPTKVVAVFDMAVFFFVSGYFHNSTLTAKDFICRKVKQLYLPFVTVSFVFLLFHNLFVSIGISETKYDIFTFLKVFGKILLFNNMETLLIPIWFLPALFGMSLLFMCSEKLISGRISGLWGYVFWLAQGCVFYVLNVLLTRMQVDIWYCNCKIINCILSSYLFYVVGYICARNKWKPVLNKKTAIISCLLTVGLTCVIIPGNVWADVRQNEYSSKKLYILCAFCGIYLIMFIARLIDLHWERCAKILALMGRNTLIILFLHPLVYKIIGLVQIYVLKIPYSGDLQYWGNVKTTGVWAYIYCALGISIPLLGNCLYKKMMKKNNI